MGSKRKKHSALTKGFIMDDTLYSHKDKLIFKDRSKIKSKGNSRNKNESNTETVKNTITTVEGRVIDVLDVPFLADKQPITIDKQHAISATIDNGFILLTESSGVSLDINSMEDIIKKETEFNVNTTEPVIFIDINVYARIFYILHRAKEITGNECAGLFIYKRLNPRVPHYLITDFILPGQEANSGAVELDDEDMGKYINYIREHHLEEIKEACINNNTLFTGNILDYIGHWHSHGNMGTFWSGTDRTQQEDKAQLGYNALGRFYLVFNLTGSILSSYVQYSPFFHRKDNTPMGLYIGNGYSFTEEDKKHLDYLIDTLIISKRTNFVKLSNRDNNYYYNYNYTK